MTAGLEYRVRSLQPDFRDDMLLEPLETVTHRQVLNDLWTVIYCWCHDQDNLPTDFESDFRIESVVRQVVSSSVVSVQHVVRKLDTKQVPYDGSAVNSKKLKTDDLFQLKKVKSPCLFPEEPLERQESVKGGEYVQVCGTCSGSSAVQCTVCGGSGVTQCNRCDGAGRITCSNCSGQGQVVVGGTSTRNCNSCDGEGTVWCPSCGATSQSRCANCTDGQMPCRSCQAQGKILYKPVLQSRLFTTRYHRLHCGSGWVEPDNSVALDAVRIGSHDWKDPYSAASSAELKDLMPEHLLSPTRRMIEGGLRPATKDTRDTGLRVELCAQYLYHIVVKHNSSHSEFFVGGCSNTVTPHIIPNVSGGLGNRIARWFARLFAALGLASGPTNRAYVEAVRSGVNHLSDTRQLGIQLKDLGTMVEVTPDGYRITPPTDDEELPYVNLSFDDTSPRHRTIQLSVTLGIAIREQLPDALAMNCSLQMGLIALEEDLDRAEERLVLVDRRPYDSANAAHINHICIMLLEEAERIRRHGQLLESTEITEELL